MMKKGSVLIQVLVTAVIVSVICAGLLSMLLLRATYNARAKQSAAATMSANGAYNAVMTAWAAAKQTCIDLRAEGFSGGGTVNTCNCTYSKGSPGGAITVTVTGTYPSCTLSVSAPPPFQLAQ